MTTPTDEPQQPDVQPAPLHWTWPADDRFSWERRHHKLSAQQLEQIRQRAEQIARKRQYPVVTALCVDLAFHEIEHV